MTALAGVELEPLSVLGSKLLSPSVKIALSHEILDQFE